MFAVDCELVLTLVCGCGIAVGKYPHALSKLLSLFVIVLGVFSQVQHNQ